MRAEPVEQEEGVVDGSGLFRWAPTYLSPYAPLDCVPIVPDWTTIITGDPILSGGTTWSTGTAVTTVTSLNSNRNQ